ncbi:MAG: zf-HC2 domain-containing protein [Candidatus Sumerlaeota bacterium]|nr:zf-HC2 domain-containing protein [Candidatus Sumerlaeota bacterium]
MKCEHAKELISPLLDGELDRLKAAEVQAHVSRCPECAEEMEGLRRLSTLYRALPEPQVPADLEQRVWAAIGKRGANTARQPAQRPAWRWPWLTGPRLAFAGGVMVFLCVMVLVYKIPESNKPTANVNRALNAMDRSAGHDAEKRDDLLHESRKNASDFSNAPAPAKSETVKEEIAKLKKDEAQPGEIAAPVPIGSPSDLRDASPKPQEATLLRVAPEKNDNGAVLPVKDGTEDRASRMETKPSPFADASQSKESRALKSMANAAPGAPGAPLAKPSAANDTAEAEKPGAPMGAATAAQPPSQLAAAAPSKIEPLSRTARLSPAAPGIQISEETNKAALRRNAETSRTKDAPVNGAAVLDERAIAKAARGTAGGINLSEAGFKESLSLGIIAGDGARRSQMMTFKYNNELPLGEAFSLPNGATIKIESISFNQMANGRMEMQLRAVAQIAKPADADTDPGKQRVLSSTLGRVQVERFTSATAQLILYVDGEANGATEINAGPIRFSLPSETTPDAEIVNIAVIPLNASRLTGVRNFSVSLIPRP